MNVYESSEIDLGTCMVHHLFYLQSTINIQKKSKVPKKVYMKTTINILKNA